MGVFADAARREFAACARDVMRREEREMLSFGNRIIGTGVWTGEELPLLRQLLNFLASCSPVVIEQRTIMGRIRITGVYMDEFSQLNKYAWEPLGYAGASTSMARMPTLKERIALAVTHAQDKLAAVREAQEIFDRNPDLERLLNLMQKNHF